jgi:hypothetical protein
MSAYRENAFNPTKPKFDFTPRKPTMRSRWDCFWDHHVFIYTTVWINWCPNGDHPPVGDEPGSHLHAFFACAYCLQPAISYLSEDYKKEMNFQDGRLAAAAFSMPGGAIGNLDHETIMSHEVLLDLMDDFHKHVAGTPPKEADYRWKDG